MALSAFQGPELRSASGLFNLMRNLGGAIGIATVNTWLGDGSRIQALRFGEAMASGGQGAREAIAALTARFSAVTPDPDLANRLAQSTVARIVAREALTIGFDEVFRVMAWMFLAALVMVPFCKALPGPAPVNPSDVH